MNSTVKADNTANVTITIPPSGIAIHYARNSTGQSVSCDLLR